MKTQIVIEIERGNIVAVHCDKDADIVIIDHDDLGAEADPRRIRELIGVQHAPDTIANPSRLKEIVKNIVEEHILGLE
jgi:hypothetical protein